MDAHERAVNDPLGVLKGRAALSILLRMRITSLSKTFLVWKLERLEEMGQTH